MPRPSWRPGRPAREEELVFGVVDNGSRRSLIDAIDVPADQGAERTILGCMGMFLTLDGDDGVILGFDTTRIHAIAAGDAAWD